ncbi:MAG: glucan biosynthesis protein G [Pseudomonadota bacterium]
MSEQAYAAPQQVGAEWFPNSYDEYRKVRMRPGSALWNAVPPQFELHAMPVGWLFKSPVTLSIVDDGASWLQTFKVEDFIDNRERKSAQLPRTGVPVSGFKINGPLNTSDIADEIIVFQGASYFRALGKGHVYGLSARGLAIRTASPQGEEFPAFRNFWVERPKPGSDTIRIYALLDSQSTTGAFAFTVTPGEATAMDVEAVLFPRRDLTEVGLAPLTSMNMLNPLNPVRVADFRPRIHDSDGLAIQTGSGERIWRPINNPATLQLSAFLDTNPRGFGLIQRQRTFADYQDLEARYDKRPSAWVEPKEGFGEGSVVLVEIPTVEEIHDNIVTMWRPKNPIPAGKPHRISYRLTWRNHVPTRSDGPWVANSRSGNVNLGPRDGRRRFVIDYVDQSPFTGEDLPEAAVTVSGGTVSDVVVQKNPETGGLRAAFIFQPGDRDRADIRLNLGSWNGRTPETWIYRWVRDR